MEISRWRRRQRRQLEIEDLASIKAFHGLAHISALFELRVTGEELHFSTDSASREGDFTRFQMLSDSLVTLAGEIRPCGSSHGPPAIAEASDDLVLGCGHLVHQSQFQVVGRSLMTAA
jgi:hypothetical protein